jgi:hypothetical protein
MIVVVPVSVVPMVPQPQSAALPATRRSPAMSIKARVYFCMMEAP